MKKIFTITQQLLTFLRRKYLYHIVIAMTINGQLSYAQTGFTATPPTNGTTGSATVGTTPALGDGTATITVVKPTGGCYAFGLDLGTNTTTNSNGFTFSSTALTLPHAAGNVWKVSSGLNSNVLTLVPTTNTTVTMSACSPRAAITLTPVLTLTAPAGILWSQSGNYVFIPTKSSSSITINVDEKSGGSFINTLCTNLCTSSWHSYSNLYWGWFTLANPTATPTNTGPYCSGGTIALTSAPSTTNTGTNAANFTYSWSGTGSFSSTTAANPTVTSGTTSSYSVVVTDGYGCVGASTSTAVTIKAAISTPSATGTLASCQLNTTAPYADLSGTVPGGGTSGIWTVTSGSGTVTSPTSSTTQVTGLSNTGSASTLTWAIGYTTAPACTATSTAVTITPPNLSTTLASVSLQNSAAAVTSPNPNYYNCKTCTVVDGQTYTYYDNVGKIIAKIQDLATPTSALASTEVCVGYDYNPPTAVTSTNVKTVTTNQGDQQPYLPRSWTIKPTTNTDVIVTLYFTNAELTTLQAKANGGRYQFSGYQLAVTKYSGGTGAGSFIAPASSGGVNVPCVFSAYNSDHQVSFSINSFSTFYIHPQFYPFAPLPIELASFTGVNIGDRNQLDWTTASEINTQRFIIEKSTDGTNWLYLNELAASGGINISHNYQSFDLTPVMGNNYYRLKSVDFDGSFTYSNTINVPLFGAVVNNIDKIYPNPTNGLIDVQIQSTSIYTTDIIVYDIIAQNVFHMPFLLNNGYNIAHLDLSHLDKGTYMVQFTDINNKKHFSKFVIQ